jgi:hypothetical protein
VKFQILGSDKKAWRDTISKYANTDQFPAKYGGTLPDNYHVCETTLSIKCVKSHLNLL